MKHYQRYGLLLSLLGVLCFAPPSWADRITFWRFDRDQNQLLFTTDSGVQPTAQLISNPTRLVIDLPGIRLGRPTVNESVGGLIRSLRVGQFDTRTTRIVIEVAPGYTLDPDKIQFRGATPTQWSVRLPAPERITSSPQSSLPEPTPTTTTTTPNAVESDNPFRVTSSGFFLSLDDSPTKVNVNRDRDNVNIDLEGVVFSEDLLTNAIAINEFGVRSARFTQVSSNPPIARVTLDTRDRDQRWQATPSSLGGVTILPLGNVTPIAASSGLATIESIDFNRDTLIVNADNEITAESRWNEQAQLYEITIPNTKIRDRLPGPQIDSNSSIAELRVRQQDERTTVLLLKPNRGYRLEPIPRGGSRSLRLSLQPEIISLDPRQINVPPPSRRSTPAQPAPTPLPTGDLPRVRNARVLVTVDPGHGGKDPGAIGIGGLREKDVVLDISLQVARLLEQQGVQVLLTRADDRFISLDGRTTMANRARADAFVSIHANAISMSRPEVNGLETYYYSSGLRLAQTIHRSILQSVSIRDRGVRQARFYVLRNSAMPAVLVETGFLTGQEDAANLRNAEHRSRLAEAIARGILLYIQGR
ncbi:MAG: N-acetylmuramoyl-L-alanine amidase [Jaaginema sp. PMC 1079.18]|nr:N-acetylmuramoyl-L-alanine amidase [Jaaginema sp. PMC 1079.18]